MFIIISALLLCINALPAYAEEEVTLAQALEYFYTNNYDILINKYEIDKASADLLGSKLLPNPTFSTNYTGLETSSVSYGDNTQRIFRIDQLIELGGKRHFRIRAAEQTLEAARLSHEDTIRNILVGFYTFFYNLSLDMLNLKLAQEELKQFEKSLDVAEKRYTAGFLSYVDFTKLKVAKVASENNVLNAERQLKIDSEQFRILIGIDKPVWPAQGQLQEIFPEYQEEEMIAKAYQSRQDLLSLQRQMKSAEYMISLAKARRIPDVTVGTEYENFGYPGKTGIGFGISLNIPIFNWNQSEVSRRHAEYRQVELQAAKTKRQVESDIHLAYSGFTTALKVYETYKNRKRDAEDLMEKSTKAFSLGGITVLDLLDTQKTYREFIGKYNQSAVQCNLNHELLKVYTGDFKK